MRHDGKIRLFLMSAAVTGIILLNAGQPGELGAEQADSVKLPPTAELLAHGRTVYQKQCSACHGARGEGDGAAAYLLYPKPRNFTSNEFRLITTLDMSATDEDLFKSITRGLPGSSMPSWGHLSERDRWALVYYVRMLTQLKAARESGKVTEEMIAKDIPWEIAEPMVNKPVDPSVLIKVPEETPVTSEGIGRGRELFLKACAACHGQQGKGDGQQKMQDTSGMPVKPRDLTAGIFKGASNSRELYSRIIGGLPGSPMPGYQGVFKDEEIWDLIHYVQTLPQKGAEERARVRSQILVARKVAGALDPKPDAPQWLDEPAVFVSLTPLWWRNDRIEGVEVRALYSGEEIGIHLSWADPTENKLTNAPQAFSDGAAVQLSGEPDPPFFGMGAAGSPVTLWNWKASWQEETSDWKDVQDRYPGLAVDHYQKQSNYEKGAAFEARDSKTAFHEPQFMTGWGAGNPLSDPRRQSAAEEARAKGLSTLTTMRPQQETVDAAAVWKDGRWHLLFRRKLSAGDKDRVQFGPGGKVSVAFAVWDGEKRDRNGQKMVSIWNELKLE